MQLFDISPFVRFSFRLSVVPKEECVVSLDCRLFYIESGEGFIEIDSVKHPINVGTLMLWQAGTPYRFILDNPIDIISINFDYTSNKKNIVNSLNPISYKPEELNRNHSFDKIAFDDCQSLNSPIILHNASSFAPVIESIVSEHNTQQNFNDAKCSALLKSCIVDIVRMENSPPLLAKSTQKLDLVIQFIHNNYQRKITNSELAELVNYHPYYLNRLMMSTNGITLHRYIINYRLTVAERLLLTTNNSIDSIALEVGFSNIISFTTDFKKKKGMPPSEFRKRFSNAL